MKTAADDVSLKGARIRKRSSSEVEMAQRLNFFPAVSSTVITFATSSSCLTLYIEEMETTEKARRW